MSEWSAPVSRWVRRATDRAGKVLGGTVRLGLVSLWSEVRLAEPCDKGRVFVTGGNVTNQGLADSLICTLRNAEKVVSKLASEGLIMRGVRMSGNRVECGIWLADISTGVRFEVGAFHENSFTAKTKLRRSGPDRPGCMYAVLFSNGKIKVGRSKYPAKRLRTHKHNAAVHDVRIVSTWVSTLVNDCHYVEAVSLEVIGRSGAIAEAGNEYFSGIDFDQVVLAMEHVVEVFS